MKRSCSMRDNDKSPKAIIPKKVSISNISSDSALSEQINMNGHHNGLNSSEAKKVANDDCERVAILDFGAQYGKIIDRRVRELKVQSQMFSLDTTASFLVDAGFKAIIISGGPSSVYAAGSPQIDPKIFTCGLPVFGICYGFQLMNKYGGGSVSKEPLREDGQCLIEVDNTCPLFHGLNEYEEVLLTHGDSVSSKTVAEGFKIVASSGRHIAGISNEKRKLYGVQFHPEVDLTKRGVDMFRNFLFNIAGCKGNFTMISREEACIDEIVKTVGDKKVLVMVSGGVDSTVCAALLNKALGPDRVTAIHVDNGFMRFEESDAVEKTLGRLNMKIHRYNFGVTFLNSTENQRREEELTLDSVTEPETKRKIIGNTFIRVKDVIMKELNLDENEYFYAQGTLRPDLIESASSLASSHADTIKTHHNDTALVRELRKKGRVIEPLKDFHKDEVRQLGRDLGIPNAIVDRHPFPGPGLAIRIICAENEFRCDDFPKYEHILNVIVNPMVKTYDPTEMNWKNTVFESLSRDDQMLLMSQTFSIQGTLLPIKSVGVQGDSRTFSYVAALSTNCEPIPWELLSKYATIIPKFLHKINRVAYVFGPKIRYPINGVTKTHLVPPIIDKLRMADKIATDFVQGGAMLPDGTIVPKFSHKIQQMPVVMIPVDFDRNISMPNSYKHSIVLRPFITVDFMTGLAAIPGRDIPEETVLEMERTIRRHVPGISRVLIDLTGKPPGTTEWE